MKNEKLFLVLAIVVALFCVFATSASAAGGVGNTHLSSYIDLGDIWMGYNTETLVGAIGEDGQNWTVLSAKLGGKHKINSSGISIAPYYWYNYDDAGNYLGKTQHGYTVSAYFSGLISSSLTDADVGSSHQSNSFNARGLRIEELSSISTYKSYFDWENQSAGYDLVSSSYSSLRALNFNVFSAHGEYYEWTPSHEPGVVEPTYFNYNVRWQGDFLPGTSVVAPAMSVHVNAVPEPSTWAMIASAICSGALMLRRRNF